MRKKRKKRRRLKSTRCKNNAITLYNSKDLEIISFISLKEDQLFKISIQIENIIQSSSDKNTTEVAKEIIVQMNEVICSVTYNIKTLCFEVSINEKYFN